MSHHDDYLSEITVDWCVTARVKAKGKPLTKTTMGGGVEACNAMIAWLDGLVIEGDRITIDITADLTSEQVPGGSEVFTFHNRGLPVEASIQYAKEWLEATGPLEGWGGSR
jgi:hypothetical protein